MSKETKAVQLFNFEAAEVRVVTIDNEPWFVGKDIAEVLGYKNPSEALQDHCRFVKRIKGSEMLVSSDYAACRAAGYSHNDAVRVWTVIPERDVYRLIMRSKKPEAEVFEEWVVGEVLPSIRKTGSYEVQPKFDIPTTFAGAMQLAANQAVQLEIAAPKLEFYENFMEAEELYTATQVAKLAGITAVEFNKRLDRLFKGEPIYSKSHLKARIFNQRFIDQGYGVHKVASSGHTQALFTALGVDHVLLHLRYTFFSETNGGKSTMIDLNPSNLLRH